MGNEESRTNEGQEIFYKRKSLTLDTKNCNIEICQTRDQKNKVEGANNKPHLTSNISMNSDGCITSEYHQAIKKTEAGIGKSTQPVKLPKSPTNMLINFAGLAGAILALLFIRKYGISLGINNMQVTFSLLIGYAFPIITLEFIFLKTYKNKSTGIDFTKKRDPNVTRTATKYLGLIFTLSILAFIYWLFKEYRGSFYDSYYNMLKIAAPILLIAAIPYFYIIDQYMVKPKDGFWQMGTILLNWTKVDKAVAWQHMLGWFVKGFFLPLMFIYFFGKMDYLRSFNLTQVFSTYKHFWDFTHSMIFVVDLLVVTVGYMSTVRLFDSHIRTTEPTLLGWFVALACYQPFWNFSSSNYFAYDTGKPWGHWFAVNSASYIVWGIMIIILLSIYVWATMPFGIRFSNLTNRGILTNGPYRFCKHPAYVSKNIAWWLIAMPFMMVSTPSEALRHSLLLLGINTIYLFRAKTEERHLSKDPVYVQYCKYMNEHSVFAWVSRFLPILKFKPVRASSRRKP